MTRRMLIATLPVVAVLAGPTGQPFIASRARPARRPPPAALPPQRRFVGCSENFDAIIGFGNGGNHTIVSGNGPDELHGADGNDTMQPFEGPDV